MSESITAKFTTTGMHCRSCSMLIKMSVEDLEGVESAEADNVAGVTEVVYDPAVVTPDAIVNEIVKAGYGAELVD